jgi:hypothetical protein
MKKQLYVTVVFTILLLFCLSLKTYAQNHQPVGQGAVGSWRLLGERVVDFTVDKDLITVTDNNICRKLKFKIADAPIDMKDMKVMFENGEVQTIPLNFRMEKGHESRMIDLAGNTRQIKVVYFNYKTVRPGFRGKAKLILFGQK